MLDVLAAKKLILPIIPEIGKEFRRAMSFLSAGYLGQSKNSFSECSKFSLQLKQLARDVKDEELANSAFVLHSFINTFSNFIDCYELVMKKEYQKSWTSLQNALDYLSISKKFIDSSEKYNLQEWESHLKEFEKLYPYRFFMSTEMIYTVTECSICGLSASDPNCSHIPGYLYWGEMAGIHCKELMLDAVAMVEHPKDKRCVVTPAGKDIFKLLELYRDHRVHPLRKFELYSIELSEPDPKLVNLKRNDRCACGSGKKYKHCCINAPKETKYYHGHLEIMKYDVSTHIFLL